MKKITKKMAENFENQHRKNFFQTVYNYCLENQISVRIEGSCTHLTFMENNSLCGFQIKECDDGTLDCYPEYYFGNKILFTDTEKGKNFIAFFLEKMKEVEAIFDAYADTIIAQKYERTLMN